MNIIHIAPEVFPFATYSSVGESIGALCNKLAQLEQTVTVFSPLYSSIDTDKFEILPTGLKTWVDAGFTVYEFELFETVYKNVRFVFFKNAELFNRIGIYGSGTFDYADNDIRFGTFSQAAMNYIKYHDVPVDIIHCHEWSTALVPVYKKLHFNDLKCKTVLTIHSVDNLGVFNKFSIEALNLPWDIYNIDGIEYFDNISFLKGGVVFSDYITTISPTFAKELTSPDFGLGLDKLFLQYSFKMEGIMKGIGYNRWNPETCRYIAANYSADDISGKEECRRAFAAEHGLDSELPIVIHASKLISARGIELIMDIAPEFDNLGANLVIAGYGSNSYNPALFKLRDSCKNTRVLVSNFMDYCFSLYAAADIILMPSLYEPCGASQLIGMRFGAIPVVRDTGGLHDGGIQAVEQGVGFMFTEFKREAMLEALKSAIQLFRSQRRQSAIKTLMSYDNSWVHAAEKYIKLYEKLTEG